MKVVHETVMTKKIIKVGDIFVTKEGVALMLTYDRDQDDYSFVNLMSGLLGKTFFDNKHSAVESLGDSQHYTSDEYHLALKLNGEVI